MPIRTPRFEETFPGLIAAFAATLVGVIFFFSRPGDALARFSFDLPSLFRGRSDAHDVVLVKMDEQTYSDLNQEYPRFDRALHAEFLRRLKTSGAKLVVFDIFFADDTPSDAEFASAIREHGNVVIGVELSPNAHPRFPGGRQIDPADKLRDLPGCSYGLLGLRRDLDLVIRRFPTNASPPFLARTAAEAFLGKQLPPDPQTRWIKYYRTNEIEEISYKYARTAGPDYFQNKIVFIGGKPKTLHVGDKADQFPTPLTRWHGDQMAGVEIHATMFLNLINNENLRRLPAWAELLVVLLVGGASGFLFAHFRPVPGLLALTLAIAVISASGIILFLSADRWFNWASVAALQLPVSWAAASIVFSRNVLKERNELKVQVETALRSHASTPSPRLELNSPVPAVAGSAPEFPICDLVLRDFEMLKRIGEGSYGEVWLARSLTGAYRAIKVIYRRNFIEERPFQREFEGVRNFEPISGKHPGWVSILHVGKDDDAGCFYYVMYPADDIRFGPAIDPSVYVPKSLAKILVEQKILPLKETVTLGIALSDALDALHTRDLVHRDVKTSNIIFVNNVPQLADIGLVIRGDETITYSGTECYLPPEGPGIGGDIYALGKVLYQTATGCHVSEYPSLPASITERKDARDLMKFLEIVNKACQAAPAKRYGTAATLREDLQKFAAALNRRWL